MKGAVAVLTSVLCVVGLFSSSPVYSSVSPRDQAELRDHVQQYRLSLSQATNLSVNQRAVIAASLAIAQYGGDFTSFNDAYRIAQAAMTERPQSDTLYKWVTDHWDYDTRTMYHHDGSGLLVEVIVERWVGSAWTNQTWRQFTYDELGRVTAEVVLVWVGGVWRNYTRTLYDYNAAGLLSESTAQSWDTGSQVWINKRRSVLVYENGLLDVSVTDNWSTDHWLHQFRETYAYNGNAQPITLVTDGFDGADWYPITRLVNSYNAQDLLAVALTSHFELGVWEPQSRLTYIYNASNQETLQTRAFYINGVWKAVGSEQTTYDAGRVSQIVTVESFFGTSISRRLYTYDDANHAMEEVAQINDLNAAADASGEWINIERTISVTEPADDVCLCPRQGDVGPRATGGDTYVNLIDVVTLVDIVYLNGVAPIPDPNCPSSRADVAPLETCGDGAVDILDVLILIDYAFRNGPRLCDPCRD